MLHHVSFAVDQPREVASHLAELLGGRLSRFGAWPGGYLVVAPDAGGTAIEIYPRGTELSPAAGGGTHFSHSYFAQRLTATHSAISVDRTEGEILTLADRAGWSASTQDRGGFEVIEVWVEDRVMLEVLTPAMLTRYLSIVDAPRTEASGTDFRSLTLSARVDTDPAVAWGAWTSAQRLSRWWPVPHARIDLRVGGAFELRFVPGASRGTEGCRILSYVPDRMLSFSWKNPPHLSGGNVLTWVVLTFTAVAGGTEVELVHNGFPLGPEGERSVEYFRQAWRRVLRRMVAHWEPEGSMAALSDLVTQPGVEVTAGV